MRASLLKIISQPVALPKHVESPRLLVLEVVEEDRAHQQLPLALENQVLKAFYTFLKGKEMFPWFVYT